MPPPTKAVLTVDTREQRPYGFAACLPSKHVDFEIRREAISAGDYSARLRDDDGLADQCTVERKSLSDLFRTLTYGRDRFLREAVRLMEYGHSCVVIESNISRIIRHAARPECRVSAKPIIASIAAISQRFSLPVWFCGTRDNAELLTFRILERWIRDRAAKLSEEVAVCQL